MKHQPTFDTVKIYFLLQTAVILKLEFSAAIMEVPSKIRAMFPRFGHLNGHDYL
jgi:hypothetical protein